jgi:hypothetical protein
VYDGVFEVLQWLLFLSAVPPVQLLTGWCVTAKAPPDISAILCSHCRKTWQLQFTYTASQPGTHQKIIDMAMNGVDAGQPPALWALASTRFSAI